MLTRIVNDPASRVETSTRRRWIGIAGVAAAFLLTFAFRWLTLTEFTNDHFDHVSVAQQLLLGEWPGRDFVDEGFPLAYLVSAAAWRLIGHPFVSEALVTVTGFAAAAALSFLVAYRASKSVLIAAAAIALQVILFPRTYSYPKLLVHAVAIAIAWWAVERLTTRRLAALAAATAFGYYYRHDHAVYLALAMTAMIAVALWHEGTSRVLRATVVYAGLTAALVLPHLLYVQWAIGLPTYFGIAREYVRDEAAGGRYRVPTFDIDRAHLWTVPELPTVNVRWVTGVSDAERLRLEAQYGLDPVERVEATTWKYRVRDAGAAGEAALRANPRVDDTHGFDAFAAASNWRARVWTVRPGPGWQVAGNSQAVLFWAWWLGPLLAAALLLRRARSHAGTDAFEAPRIAMLIVLGWCAAAGFLRYPLQVRLPDPAVPQAILAAWIAAAAWRWPSSRGRRVARAATCVLAVLIAFAAVVEGDGVRRIGDSRLLAGPRATFDRWQTITAGLLDEMPGPVPSNPSRLLVPFFTYLQQCTAPSDRLLFAGYSPEVFVVARRGFAGDHRKFLPPFHSEPWEQARTLERFSRQHVPFAIVPSTQRAAFAATYPALWRIVQERYLPFATIPIGQGQRLDIFREASWPQGRTGGSAEACETSELLSQRPAAR